MPDSVEIPLELRARSKPVDVVLYLDLVCLARRAERELFQLPTLRELAKTVPCNYRVLRSALGRLHASGWITVHGLDREPGAHRRQRFFITVKEQKTVLAKTVTASEISVPAQGTTQENIPRSTWCIPACTLRDVTGKTLSDYTAGDLTRASGNAPLEDIQTAILEVENFRGRDRKPVRNVLALFAGRFTKPRGKQGTLNPHRIYPLWCHVSQSGANTVDTQPPPGANFYPVVSCGFTASHIDAVCKLLNERSTIERGLIPTHQLVRNAHALEYSRDEPRVRLRDEFTLERVSPGVWKLWPVPVRAALAKRSKENTPRTLQDALAVLTIGGNGASS